MRPQLGLNKWKKHTKPEGTALPTPSAARFWLLHLDQLTELFKPHFSHLDSGKIVSSPLLGDVSKWSNSWLCSEQSLIFNKRQSLLLSLLVFLVQPRTPVLQMLRL